MLSLILLCICCTSVLGLSTYHQASRILKPTANICHKSYDCYNGYCCRDSNNVLVDPSWISLGSEDIPGPPGTCTYGKAQLGKVCSGGCQCDDGLVCYQEVTGACCPAKRCKTPEYVAEQNAYWKNCEKDPNCHWPA